jgi:hypothetical protein
MLHGEVRSTGSPDAKNLLLAIAQDGAQPAIGRATAYAELALYLTPSLFSEAQKGWRNESELVRLGALRGLAGMPIEQRWEAQRQHDKAEPRSGGMISFDDSCPAPSRARQGHDCYYWE